MAVKDTQFNMHHKVFIFILHRWIIRRSRYIAKPGYPVTLELPAKDRLVKIECFLCVSNEIQISTYACHGYLLMGERMLKVYVKINKKFPIALSLN